MAVDELRGTLFLSSGNCTSLGGTVFTYALAGLTVLLPFYMAIVVFDRVLAPFIGNNSVR